MKFLRPLNPTLRFSIPVILETCFSTFCNLIFSSLIGGISGTSLTTISQGNLALNLISAALSMMTTGSSILCARLLGAREPEEASRVVEQTMLLMGFCSLVITALCLLFTDPIIALLMPNAEAYVLAEGATYFRVMILSLPFLQLTNVLVGVLRSSGDSRSAMIVGISLITLQLLFALLFLRLLKLEVVGAGLTFLCCRVLTLVLALYILLRSHRYTIRLRNCLRPHLATLKRIFVIGLPTSIEAIFVHAGYLVGSAMAIGLGAFEAAVYSVANTLYSFASLPQSIFSVVALTVVGQLIGAKEYKQAKKTGWRLWRYAMLSITVFSVLLILFRARLTPLYSADPAVQKAAAFAILAALTMNPPGTSLNTLDPQLRVGGDVKFVMVTTVLAVWLIRLPLTYLFCYHWTWGAPGVFLANAISLCFRMLCNTIRFAKGKYLYMRV